MTGDVAGQTDAAETGRNRVVVVGGGFGGVQAVRKLRRAPVGVTRRPAQLLALPAARVPGRDRRALTRRDRSPLRGIFKRDESVRVVWERSRASTSSTGASW